MKKSFVMFEAIFALFLGASSVPSALYVIYQQQWHFSALTLTAVFAAYALTLLMAILFFGSLSDKFGRRPLLMGALVIEAIAMVVFALAHGVPDLLAARLLQGFATGIATTTLSAALIDTQPPDRPKLASLVATLVPIASLGAGAVASGALAQYVAWPTQLIFWLVCFGAVLALLGVITMPESNTRRPAGWLQSIKPVMHIPSAAKVPLISSGPSLVASWAIASLYLSLGPSLIVQLLQSNNHLVGGLVITTFTSVGAAAIWATRKWSDKRLLLCGAPVAIVGLLLTIFATTQSAVILFFIATILAGLGFGPAFTGAFRSIMSQAAPTDRASLASVVYTISYVAFGLPAILAGVAAVHVGLQSTVVLYSTAAASLYAITLLRLVRNRS